MSQSNLKKVFSKLRVEVGPRRRMSNPLGPEGRLLKLRKTVTALMKHERIELFHNVGDESRGYAERLISDAIRYGEYHKETMEMASYWLMEKQVVHKLFKVLVPRYQDCKYSYTRMWKAPREIPGFGRDKCVLELRGNIYPNLARSHYLNFNLLHNKLLDEVRIEVETEREEAARAARIAAGSRISEDTSGDKSSNSETSDGDSSDDGSSDDDTTDGTNEDKPSEPKTMSKDERT